LVAINIAGIHRVTKKLASGRVVEYHYAFRGGPQFWNSASGALRGGADYFAAFQRANDKLTERFRRAPKGDTIADLIGRYRGSAKFTNLRERTQADYEVWLKRINTEFGEDPIAMFEEPESVAEIGRWKKTWSGSPKQYDYATSVISVLLNWAVDEDKTLMRHHYHRVPRIYKANRADLIWRPEELVALCTGAPEAARRIAVAASVGGLRPSDLGRIKLAHVEATPTGRRIYLKTRKRGQMVNIPVTQALAEIIDSTPAGQDYLLVNTTGGPLTAPRAAQMIRDLKTAANARQAGAVREELRLYDMRGTAATELLRAGCALNEIAVYMGWDLRHAATIIGIYSKLIPEVADDIRDKLEARSARDAARAEKKAAE